MLLIKREDGGMLELVFSFGNNSCGYGERLKSAFKNCCQISFEETEGTIKIALDSKTDNWLHIWPAVWGLVEQEWFASAISRWELVVLEQDLSFKEDLLGYCYENKKGFCLEKSCRQAPTDEGKF